MSTDWTIDTYVLYKAADVDYDAVEFLNRVLREKHRVTFDHERHIEKEYQKCFKKIQRERKDGSRAVKKWFGTAVKLAQKFSGRLQERDRRVLEKLWFKDQNDWPFVAVCSKTQSKQLVTEDSHYSENVKRYLQSKMAINVLSIRDSLQKTTSVPFNI